MLFDSSDIAEYILKNHPQAKKIVEVGIGFEDSVYREIKLKGLNAVATDIEPMDDAVTDDITNPLLEFYEDADVIYSIRPNPEMIENIRKIAKTVGSDLIIRLFSTDSQYKPNEMKLVNYKKAVLWTEP